MKTIFFLLTAMIFTTAGFSQGKGSVKLYGFAQSVSGGKAPELSEDTGLRTSEGAGKNYWLYAVSPARIYPAELWINGTRYGVSIKSVAKTPVVYTDENYFGSPKKTLVPKTSQKVVQLIPEAGAGTKSIGTKAPGLSKDNAVVLVYKLNGKFYYQTLREMSKLDAINMQ